MLLSIVFIDLRAGPIANFIGRKASIWVACILCIVSNVVMMTTTSIGGLYAGRLVIGLANGLYMTFSQLYLQVSSFLSCSRDVAYLFPQECAPARYRGLTVGAFQSWTSIGKDQHQ